MTELGCPEVIPCTVRLRGWQDTQIHLLTDENVPSTILVPLLPRSFISPIIYCSPHSSFAVIHFTALVPILCGILTLLSQTLVCLFFCLPDFLHHGYSFIHGNNGNKIQKSTGDKMIIVFLNIFLIWLFILYVVAWGKSDTASQRRGQT